MSLRLALVYFIAISLFLPSTRAELTAIRSTADLKERLTEISPPQLVPSGRGNDGIKTNTIIVDRAARHQTILGFGGTYSESTAYNLIRLNAKTRQEVLESFFSPSRGAGFSLLRTTINSCDASSEHYSYAPVADDAELKHFSIQKDIDNGMIPGLQGALAVPGADFRIFASPWTAPVWMKTSGKFDSGSLKPEYRKAWARYFVKYLEGYQKHGVPIWGITPQNEPEAYQQKWDAMGWTAEEMRLFLAEFLIPELEAHAPNVKIIAYDHNKNHLLAWADELMSDKKVADALWGFVHHWYDEGEGKFYEPLDELQRRYPDKPFFASEQGMFAPLLGAGEPAEIYARDLIENMNHNSVGWVVWGLAFDTNGGPNHANNLNHSPIMVDVENNVVHYNPSYYYLAQVSKYVRPGARRLSVTNSSEELLACSFENPDGSIVVVLLNTTDTEIPCTIDFGSQEGASTSPSHSLTTFRLD